MTPHRDEPQYGQRATPEEQARAVAQSGGVQEWQRRAAIPPAHERHAHPEPPTTGGTYTINRLVTLILLGIGLIAVVQSAFGYLELGATIQTLYTEQGIGDYQTTELTSVIGVTLIVVHATVWVATTWVSLRVLSRGRTAWWIPLVGATINFAIMAILLATLLIADPAFLHHIGAA